MRRLLPLLLLLTASFCLGGLIKYNNEYDEFYHSLPEEVKLPFLQYQLAKAVVVELGNSRLKPYISNEDLETPSGLNMSEETFKSVEALTPPEGFSGHLYELVEKTYELNVLEITAMARTGQTCKWSECHDIGDVGGNCC
ncbi:uncharacterized protein [Periplaneta americana]|uniref:uncharacterized protein n=1 Tax=Periplaneta americana TaxID=6978 RepID=UPI0037E9C05D